MSIAMRLSVLPPVWACALACGVTLGVACGCGTATAQTTGPAAPAQVPLINRTGTGVKPNLVITLDDSNSMAFQHMPEGSVVFLVLPVLAATEAALL